MTNKEKALEITEQFVANWEIWQIVGFLDKFGIGPQSAEGVYKKLGEGALERISENPYILVDVASKVNFEKVDRIAMEMGVEESNYKRIRSGIKYGLEKIGLNGNSCVLYDNLIKYEQDLLRVDINNIEEAIIQMKAKEEIVLEDRPDGKEWVYSKNFYEAEKNIAEKIVFTGMIDEFYNYKFGKLEYRSLRFETEILNEENYQGNAVVNYTEREIPYTRIIEHKHFEFGKQEKTVITKEYPSEWKEGDEPYYPVNDEKNNELYEKYRELAEKETNVIFGGRLGEYKYYDMDKVIEKALGDIKLV